MIKNNRLRKDDSFSEPIELLDLQGVQDEGEERYPVFEGNIYDCFTYTPFL